jgi:hypothetical protein
VIIIIYPIFFSIFYWKTIDIIGKTIIIIYVKRNPEERTGATDTGSPPKRNTVQEHGAASRIEW